MRNGLRVFGHPLHAMLSAFPIALLGTSLFWDLLGIFRHEAVWWAISFWSMALGLAAAAITAIAGFVDYAAMPESPAVETGTRHMMLMLTTVSLYAISLFMRRSAAPPTGTVLIAVLSLEGLGALLLGVGGWHGAHLVFHHGIGRD